MTILDQTSDPGLATMRVLLEENPALYSFSKTASMNPDEFNQLPDNAFAWPGMRRFPIHTPEHAALSMAYTKTATSRIPRDVVLNLARAAGVYGITADLFLQEKTASVADAEYLLPEDRRFLVKTAVDVELAENLFFEKLAQIPLEKRAIFARNLVQAAAKREVELSPETYKLACYTMTNTQIFRDWMRARAFAAEKCGAATQADAFNALGDAYRKAEPLLDVPADQAKLAACVYDLDKQAGLTECYGSTLPDPLCTVYNTDLRREDFVKVGSVLQNKALLQQVPLSFWQDALGDEISAEIAPDGSVDVALLEQILPTLPADMKAAVQTQLAAYNK